MALFRNTASELVERTARILGVRGKHWNGGTCTGGSTTTFVDTSRTEPDDYFQNTVPVSRVRIWSTTDGLAPQGQERTMSDWVNSTWTGTVSAEFTVAPAAGDKYCIMSEYSWDEIFHTINDAIDLTKGLAVIQKIDTSIVLADSVYEYDIPSGFTHIYRVSMEDGSGNFPEPIPPDQYKIIRAANMPRLHLTRFPTVNVANDLHYTGYWADYELSSAHALRLEGFGSQATLVNDIDLCYVDPNFIIHQAAAFLHSRRATRGDTDPTGHQAQYAICQAIADKVRLQAITSFPPDTKKVF